MKKEFVNYKIIILMSLISFSCERHISNSKKYWLNTYVKDSIIYCTGKVKGYVSIEFKNADKNRYQPLFFLSNRQIMASNDTAYFSLKFPCNKENEIVSKKINGFVIVKHKKSAALDTLDYELNFKIKNIDNIKEK